MSPAPKMRSADELIRADALAPSLLAPTRPHCVPPKARLPRKKRDRGANSEGSRIRQARQIVKKILAGGAPQA